MTIEQLSDRVKAIFLIGDISELGVDDLEEIGCIIELLHKTDYLTDVERNLMLQRVEDVIEEEKEKELINKHTFDWMNRLREAEGIMKRVKIPYGRWKLYGLNVIQIAIDGHSYYGLMMDKMGYIKGYMVITDEYRDKAKAIIKEVERTQSTEAPNNANTISNDKGEAPDSE